MTSKPYQRGKRGAGRHVQLPEYLQASEAWSTFKPGPRPSERRLGCALGVCLHLGCRKPLRRAKRLLNALTSARGANG
jgi:hypothetical protein